jgi:hypothetical protein
MLIRAIAAFVALPGIVAFALPIANYAGRPVRCPALAAVPLFLGMSLLLWCVREFYADCLERPMHRVHKGMTYARMLRRG